MSNGDSSPALPREQDTFEQSEQVTLLGSRFRRQEVQALMALRQRQWQTPEPLDAAADEARLHFARWMVRQGWLSEGEPSEEPDWAARWQPAPSQVSVAGASVSPRRTEWSSWRTGRRWGTSKVPLHAGLRAIPDGAGRWLSQATAQMWTILCRIARWVCEPDESWDGSYGPYSSYVHLSPWLYPEDPFFWRHFHPDR